MSPSAVTRNLDMKATAPPDTTRTRLLEEQVAALHEELRAKDHRLQATAAELQQLQRQLSSVTQNLDEMERRHREAEALKQKLAESEAALRRVEESGSRDGEALKAQLKEALTERTDLLHQVEELNLQLSEKTQRTIELLKERDRLQHQALELETAVEARDAALAEAREAQAQLNATLEGMVEKHTALEEVHQAALLEVAAQKERAHTLQLELAGLEATMRGQGRDLAEISERLQRAEAENEALREAAAERDQRLAALGEEAQRLEEALREASQQAAEARQRLDEAVIQHEGERLELMNGVDQKEAELGRMAQVLQAQQEAHAALEGEKQDVEARLVEHRERLGQMDELLQEVVERLRRGSDLARG